MTRNSAEAAYPGRLSGGVPLAVRHRAALLLAAACTMAVGLAGCATTTGSASGQSTSSPGTDSGVTAQSAAASSSAAAGGDNSGTGNGNGGGSGSGNGGSSTKSASPKSSTNTSCSTCVKIVYFKVEGSAACPESGQAVNSPGGITIAWKVTGGTNVALSIDDPNFFAQHGSGTYRSDYPTTGTESLSFPCEVNIGATATHSYTIDTIGGNGHRSMTIKASAVYHG
jgi:hypothetical protein